LQDSANLTFSGSALGVTGTIGVSGVLTSTVTSALITNAISGDTNAIYHHVKNTGGEVYIGLNNNANAGLITGGGNYATCILNPSATNIAFATNGTLAMTITSAGLVGIGTSSPNTSLEVAATGVNQVGTVYTNINAVNSAKTLGLSFGYDTANGGVIASGGVDKPIAFWQYSTSAANYVERMRIDSSGNVGIGVTANTTNLGGTYSLLSVGKSGGSGVFMGQSDSTGSGSTVAQFFGKTTGASGYQLVGGMLIATDGTSTTDAVGRLQFYTSTGGSVSERMRIDSSGNVTLQKNISVGAATPTTSGTGITFPATQSASSDANTLDDYEEGTWTPQIAGDATQGAGTYTQQVGTYTKIGRVVYLQGNISWTAHTGVGNMLLWNFPFTSNTTAGVEHAVSFSTINNITIPASSVVVGLMGNNKTYADLRCYALGTGVANNIALDTAGTINFSIVYEV
jgi:hypothetical protein